MLLSPNDLARVSSCKAVSNGSPLDPAIRLPASRLRIVEADRSGTKKKRERSFQMRVRREGFGEFIENKEKKRKLDIYTYEFIIGGNRGGGI